MKSQSLYLICALFLAVVPLQAHGQLAVAPSAPAAPAPYDPAKYKDADDLWMYIQSSLGVLQVRFNSTEEALLVVKPAMNNLDRALADFAQGYPTDERHSDAVILRTQIWNLMGQIELRPFDLAEVDALLKTVIDSPTSLKSKKADALFCMIQYRIERLDEKAPKEAFVSANEKIEAFLKEYPSDRRIDMVMLVQAKVLGKIDSERQVALLKKLAQSENVRVAMSAQQELTALEIKQKPLDLKFVDLNGKQVDIADLRGKVVLIDFWATWCKPCMMDLPNVLQAYEKYKAKGLQILGVSWDHDKDQLVAFLKEHSMDWPQYFEGNGSGQDQISRRFGIMGIPTQWLVDKKGFVRNMDARGDLDQQIAKLLSE